MTSVFSSKDIFSSIRRFAGALLVAGSFAVASSEECVAQNPKYPEFRIDSDIYEDMQKPPIKNNLTLFREGVAYDMERTDNTMVTIIDPLRDRVVLLDSKKQLKAEVSTKSLNEKVNSAKLQLKDAERKRFMPIVEPAFNAAGQAIVKSEAFRYQCQVQKPSDPQIAELYADFADWSARLNAAYPPHLPPYLRLELNTFLKRNGVLPKEIERTETRGSKELKLTVRLISNYRLSADDQSLLNRIGPMLVSYKQVEIEEFFKK